MLAAGVLALMLTAPTRAYAEAESFRVPEGCGTLEDLREGVSRLAGGEATLSWPAALEITPVEAGEQFELRLTLDGETRVLRDSACETLFRSAQIMIAATASSPPTAAAVEERPPTPWRATVAAGGGAALGAVPNLGGRLDVQMQLLKGAWGLQASGHYLVPSTVASSATRPGLQVGGYGARLGASFAALAWLRLFVGAELSYLRGEALDAAAGAWMISPAIEASLRVLRFGEGFLDLAVSGQWALVRPQFEVRGIGVLYRLPPLAGSANMRLGWAIF